MKAKKIIIGASVLALSAALVGGILYVKRDTGTIVQVEKLEQRNLEAIVSASGTIQAKTTINVSANTMGRVVKLDVEEGDIVKQGQFLLQIDPRSLKTQVERGEAGLVAQRTAVDQAKVQLESALTQLKLAQDTLKRQQDLWKDQLTTRESLDRAENEVHVREREVENRQAEISMQTTRTRQTAADLDNAKYNLSQVTIESPIDGIVTRRNIELGETVVIGTMNNAGTVLLTIADMSVIETELEVDETDIPSLQLGQTANITIDALPDQTFTGKVTEIGNSPIQATASATTRATNFKVVVTVDGQIPAVRPGFTCTADITTATRTNALAIPIQATTVRELIFDEKGNVVRDPAANGGSGDAETRTATATLPKGQVRKEVEGVFLFKAGKAAFAPVTMGISGEKYFEVLSGVKAGDEVITGPFNSVRDLQDGHAVKLEPPTKK